MPRIIHVAFSFFTTSAVRVLYVITFTLGSFLYLFSISARFFWALSLLFSLFMPMPIITLSNIVSDLFTMFSCPIVKGLKLPEKRAMRSILFLNNEICLVNSTSPNFYVGICVRIKDINIVV